MLDLPPADFTPITTEQVAPKQEDKTMTTYSFSQTLANMEPKIIWEYFYEMSQIYRESGHNEEISNYLKAKLETLGFTVEQETDGLAKYNIIATRNVDREKKNAIILQAHMDMVAVSADDNPKKPIKFIVDGDYLKANDRTLGADNGIGLAIALAVAEDKNFQDLPLQMLFTVDEETGLYGAEGIDKEDFHGNYLINLDSEEFGIVTMGCAALISVNEKIPAPMIKVDVTEFTPYKISITEASGGHSGMDIDKNRINPIREGMKLLNNYPEIKIVSLEGGQRFNSIPRDFHATILVDKNDQETVTSIEESLNSIVSTYKETDPLLKANFQELSTSENTIKKALEPDFQAKTTAIIAENLKNGLLSTYKNGDSKTSQNIGIIKLENGYLTIVISLRSSDVKEKQELIEHTTSTLSTLAGNPVEPDRGSPIWQPIEGSELANLAVKAYQEVGVEEAHTQVVHGGLENAIFAKTIPGIEQISVGPDIVDAHTITERVKISSVKDFYAYMQVLLQKIKTKYYSNLEE